MTAIEHEIVIRRPIEEVFEFTVDPDNVPLWQPAVIEMRAEGPVGVGQRVVQTRRLLGRRIDLVVEVTEFDPPHRFGMRIVSGPLKGTLRSTFAAVAEGTRVALIAEVPGAGLMRAANMLAAEAAKRELAANCRRLKDLIESAPSP